MAVSAVVDANGDAKLERGTPAAGVRADGKAAHPGMPTVGPPSAFPRLELKAPPAKGAEGQGILGFGQRPAPTGPGRALAVVAVHGMGQQVPFSTMDDVANGLRKADRRATRAKELPAVEAETVLIGDKKMQRLKTSLAGPDGPIDVHVYEAYWAPQTQGAIGLRGTISFLLRAGLAGVKRSGGDFQRWMFGGPVTFPHSQLRWVRAKLLLAVLALWALVGLDALVGAVGAAALTDLGPGKWPQPYLLADLTFLVSVPIGMAILFLWAARRPAKSLARERREQAQTWSSWGMAWFVATALGLVLTAAACGVVVVADAFRGRGLIPDLGLFGPRAWLGSVLAGFWVMLLYGTKQVRGFVVKSVGDVAIYVSPQYLDDFAEKRQAIKDLAAGVSHAVFGALEKDGQSFQYRGVAFIGHSLGSVVAYDALNSTLNDDSLRGGPLRALNRTQGLLTFGSPLDRTAYIFANQVDAGRWEREALAATVQPLVMSYANRRFPWVNVHAPADIISSRLLFYDDAGSTAPGHKVENIQDPLALTPVLAHTEYWRTEVVWDELRKMLLRPAVDQGEKVEAPQLVKAS